MSLGQVVDQHPAALEAEQAVVALVHEAVVVVRNHLKNNQGCGIGIL